MATPTPGPGRVVPKGLRSFDAGDADFFLELVPGPRDREGLPEGLRFWKARVEEADPDNTFAVGLLYGPSGAGKSSLVKAGLLPRLAGNVLAVYVEATADETEARVLKGLHKHCPDLPAGLGLVEAVAALRRERDLAAGRKVLLVLDQFEQWLHARREGQNAEVVRALRQCDGGRVQCLVMVRDDFWMAATRFMRDLEIRLLEGQNSAAVDLFDGDHARKVLAAFGRAFGKLPEGGQTREQDDFLNQAIAGLTREGKVICVRLALFAEMLKGRPWAPTTLKEVGGAEGVGVAFLEETFSAATAPPEHRYHQQAARAVLKALLPEAGTDLKGHRRSDADLRAASGYAGRPRDFDDLLRILDGEVRLLTPTDPEGNPGEPARYYQLTHDYLVPALRDWLTRKQKETRRGRAELRLADRAALWNAKPENRLLPACWEWAAIRLLTRPRDWTPPQRRLMRRAGRYHALRGGLLALALALLAFGGWWASGALRARARVDTLLAAGTADVPDLVQDLAPYRRWADPLLRAQAARRDLDDGKRLHVALALLPVDPGQADYLCDRLLTAERSEEVKAIRTVLRASAPGAAARFWPVLQDDNQVRSRRLRAACALALADADDPRWPEVGNEVVRCLAGENILSLRDWAELLEPVRAHLVRHQVRRLVEADAGGFAAFLAMVSAYPEDAPAALHAHLERKPRSSAPLDDRLALARQQAQAAAALLLLGRPERVWPVFHQGADPTCRTYLIHRCAALAVDPAVLARRLLGHEEKDPSVRQGLLLALGEYGTDQRADLVRGPLMAPLAERVLKDYRDDPDPGVHSGAEWLLRRWGMKDRSSRIDRELVEGSPGRAPGEVTRPRWYVNGQGQTLAVIPAPGAFEVGSPPGERGRFGSEDRRPAQLDYPFAVGLKPVTVAEFLKFRPHFGHHPEFSRGQDTPIDTVTWYEAAAYCNWLSEQEKLPKDQWCYEPNAKGEYAEDMRVKVHYEELSGYRLPRQWEWEYACRAGTVTAWSHGSDEALLPQYAWYMLNAGSTMHPVGALKPNGLGLFDVHGNTWEWCQDVWKSPTNQDSVGVKNGLERCVRSGSFKYDASYTRSAFRGGALPDNRLDAPGFRVARTYR